jgi:predicted esterase YcpF (UPF0227 family)
MASLADDHDDGEHDMDIGDDDEGGYEENKSDDGDGDDMEMDEPEVLPPAVKPQGKYIVEIDRSRVRTGGQYAKSVKLTAKKHVAPPTDVKKSNFDAALRSAGADDVLSNAEVAILLAQYGDPNTTGANGALQSTSVFDSTLEYVKRFSSVKNPTTKVAYVEALRKDLEAMRFSHEKSNSGEEEEYKMEPFEIAALCNLDLQEPNQVKVLIPSLNRLDDEQLTNILDSISKSAARRS